MNSSSPTILVNAFSGIGDALMFSPALRALKRELPEAEIDMLVMFHAVGELYGANPHLREIIHIDFLKQSKGKSLGQVLKLRANNYDYSLNIYPSNRWEYNFVQSLIGAKKKISHNYLHTNALRGEWLNDVLVPEVQNRHNVVQNLELVKAIAGNEILEAGPMEVFIPDSAKSAATGWLKEKGLQGKLLIGFHPGSATLKNQINKRWAKEKFAELGMKLVEESGATILLFGNETELQREIFSLMNGKTMIVSTPNFMDSLAIMERCKLFVSNDSGFLHSAAALGLSTVAVFGYTNAKELYPWKTRHVVVRHELECSPCFYNSPKPASCLWTGDDEFKCIRRIEVEEVYEACKQLL